MARMADVERWRTDRDIPSLPHAGASASPPPSPALLNGDPNRSQAPAPGNTVDESLSFGGLILEGLPLPSDIDLEDANTLKLAYACETADIIHAEAFIAEREYHRSLIRAKARKMHMDKTRDRFDGVIGDLVKIRDSAHPRHAPGGPVVLDEPRRLRPLGTPGLAVRDLLGMGSGPSNLNAVGASTS